METQSVRNAGECFNFSEQFSQAQNGCCQCGKRLSMRKVQNRERLSPHEMSDNSPEVKAASKNSRTADTCETLLCRL